LKQYNPRKVVFLVTHFHSSKEGRLNLSNQVLDEIITTNTIPSILNRDVQGRLRARIAVLKTSRWIGHHLRKRFGLDEGDLKGKWYQEDMSSRNPRSGFHY
jgi:ribose-phosphate pyrophosphokinase